MAKKIKELVREIKEFPSIDDLYYNEIEGEEITFRYNDGGGDYADSVDVSIEQIKDPRLQKLLKEAIEERERYIERELRTLEKLKTFIIEEDQNGKK